MTRNFFLLITINNERQVASRLLISMFIGTPCMSNACQTLMFDFFPFFSHHQFSYVKNSINDKKEQPSYYRHFLWPELQILYI